MSILLLLACSGSPGDVADDTADTDTDAAVDGDTPPVPVVAEGEGAVVVRYDGADTTFTCATADDAGGLWSDYPGVGPGLLLGCGVDLNRNLRLEAYVPAIAAGTYPLTLQAEGDVPADRLTVNFFPDGLNGFRVDGPVAGTLTLTEVGGAGANGVGTLVASWASANLWVDGEDSPDPAGPGAIAMAFDLPFDGP